MFVFVCTLVNGIFVLTVKGARILFVVYEQFHAGEPTKREIS